jgi:hypothetical protein
LATQGIPPFVIPAKAGIQLHFEVDQSWTPAFAGVTSEGVGLISSFKPTICPPLPHVDGGRVMIARVHVLVYFWAHGGK